MRTREQLETVIDQWGPWTAHNIELAPGLYTRPENGATPNPRLRQVLQLVSDIMGSEDLSGVRVADLGCLEGAFAIELALHGAEVVGIEGRESNVSRASFAASALSLKHCTFELDDARNFGKDKYGEFDVVLCLGLLYHLDAESVFGLLRAMYESARRAVLIDTHVSLIGGRVTRCGDKTYEGHLFREHSETDSAGDRQARQWASLDNSESFWLTRSSLFDALAEVGFSSVLECHLPQSTLMRADRIQLLAFKGAALDIRTVPQPALSLPPYHAPKEGASWRADVREAAHLSLQAAGQLGGAARRRLRNHLKSMP